MNKVFLVSAIFILLFASQIPIWAEPEFGLGVSPGASSYEIDQSTTPEEFIPDRFAQELAQELLSTRTSDFWNLVEISTSQATQNLTIYVRRGFGRAELITLILLSENTGKNLKKLARERIEGATLRELCFNNNAPYDEIRPQALALKSQLLERMRIKLENPNYESRESGEPSAISTDSFKSIEPSTGTIPAEQSIGQPEPSDVPKP